jgi:hypothetical protein
VATWTQFRTVAPDVAAAATQLWPGITALDDEEEPSAAGGVISIAYLATVRADGSRRVHPVCPILAGGRLFAAIPRASPKGWDLRRDPRCVIHALPGPEDGELCVRARAVEVTEDVTRALVRETVGRTGVGGMVESVSNDALFESTSSRSTSLAGWTSAGRARARCAANGAPRRLDSRPSGRCGGAGSPPGRAPRRLGSTGCLGQFGEGSFEEVGVVPGIGQHVAIGDHGEDELADVAADPVQ